MRKLWQCLLSSAQRYHLACCAMNWKSDSMCNLPIEPLTKLFSLGKHSWCKTHRSRAFHISLKDSERKLQLFCIIARFPWCPVPSWKRAFFWDAFTWMECLKFRSWICNHNKAEEKNLIIFSILQSISIRCCINKALCHALCNHVSKGCLSLLKYQWEEQRY